LVGGGGTPEDVKHEGIRLISLDEEVGRQLKVFAPACQLDPHLDEPHDPLLGLAGRTSRTSLSGGNSLAMPSVSLRTYLATDQPVMGAGTAACESWKPARSWPISSVNLIMPTAQLNKQKEYMAPWTRNVSISFEPRGGDEARHVLFTAAVAEAASG
jgi:hypothetical protein